jgi:hypothetical protein
MSTATRKDIELLSGKTGTGTKTVNVAASATLIYPGDVVACGVGVNVGSLLATNKPVVATDFVLGIATTTSTNTAAAAGTVQVRAVDSSDVWLITPNDITAFDTQAEYDALVGDRVLFDLTSTKYTLLATDGATYGCVIQPLDIKLYPAKVAFSFRSGCNTLV